MRATLALQASFDFEVFAVLAIAFDV